jgi:hypothetical protein
MVMLVPRGCVKRTELLYLFSSAWQSKGSSGDRHLNSSVGVAAQKSERSVAKRRRSEERLYQVTGECADAILGFRVCIDSM